MKASDEPIVVEQTFNADIDTVWKSITEVDLMRQWYFDNIPSTLPRSSFREPNELEHPERIDELRASVGLGALDDYKAVFVGLVVVQREVLGMLEKLLEAKETSRQNYAYLYDRVASAEDRPQRYGTQGRCVGPAKWEPNELEHPEGIDELDQQPGLMIGLLPEFASWSSGGRSTPAT